MVAKIKEEEYLPVHSYRTGSVVCAVGTEGMLLSFKMRSVVDLLFLVLANRQEDRQLVSCLLFWQDVTDYGKEEDRSADRLLRLCHAWNIYNTYFPDGANYPIGRHLVCQLLVR